MHARVRVRIVLAGRQRVAPLRLPRFPRRVPRLPRGRRAPGGRDLAARLVVVGDAGNGGGRGELLSVESAELRGVGVHQDAEVDSAVEAAAEAARVLAIEAVRGELRAEMALRGGAVRHARLCESEEKKEEKTGGEVEEAGGVEVEGIV